MGAMTRTAARQGTDVLASAAAGNEFAFRRIIAEYHDDMRRVCSYVTRDEAVADEAGGVQRGPDDVFRGVVDRQR